MQSKRTWELVDQSPGAAVVGCRWVLFTLKYLPDDSVDCYKACLVAKGFTQTYDVDYFETFSLVTCLSSVHISLSIAVITTVNRCTNLISKKCLYGNFQEEVYMKQSPGFIIQRECTKFCKLHKAIYGLKQSPRAWFEWFSKAIHCVYLFLF